MRLFRRDTPAPEKPRCPECGERIPDGASACAMCGHRFADPAATVASPGEQEPTDPHAA